MSDLSTQQFFGAQIIFVSAQKLSQCTNISCQCTNYNFSVHKLNFLSAQNFSYVSVITS